LTPSGAETTRTTTPVRVGVEAYQLRDVRRRVHNILDAFPASSWDLAESEVIFAALAGIVRGRPEGERLTS
jgi:hypothetical protein